MFQSKNGERTPQWLIIGRPISQYASSAAIFCLLHSYISIEEHEKHLYNPSTCYAKYGRFTCEVHTPYLDA